MVNCITVRSLCRRMKNIYFGASSLDFFIGTRKNRKNAKKK